MVREYLVGSTRGGGKGKRGCRCSVVELGVRLGDLIWRNRKRGDSLQLAFLLPLQEWTISILYVKLYYKDSLLMTLKTDGGPM